MSSSLQHGYAELRSAIADAGLTSSGASWLSKALDPYHDVPLALTGLPDHVAQKTTVREFKKSFTISSSSINGDEPTSSLTLGASDKWDCQINLLGLLHRSDITPGTQASCLLINKGNNNLFLDTFSGANAPPVLFPLQVAACKSGVQCWPSPKDSIVPFPPAVSFDFTTTATRKYNGVEPFGLAQLNQPTRVLGCAFEVVNVTADQYKDGTCTVYRVNSSFDVEPREQYSYVPFGTFPGGILTQNVLLSLPLNDQGDMMNLPGTRQWTAAEGAYCVGALDPRCLGKFEDALGAKPMIAVNRDIALDLISNPNAFQMGIGYYDAWKRPINVDATFNPDNGYGPFTVFSSPCQTSGALFSGLDQKTVLQVNVRWVVESIPDYDEADIHLAKVSSQLDTPALELYAKTVQVMPPGVPVRFNPLGEWFDQIMAIVANIAPQVGGVIGTAVAGMPGQAAGQMFGRALGMGAAGLAGFNSSLRPRVAKRQRIGGGRGPIIEDVT